MNLQELSDALAAAVETAGKSTVTVDARGRIPATGVVWSADGEILTADHVVQRDDNINVILPDGSSHPARLLGRDPASDLALLKIEASGLAVPVWTEVKVGHLVLALGRPDDLQAALSNVVSIGGPVRGPFRHLEAYIQTDVTMFPGFSGGPLVDVRGRVAGINSSALARGASVAVPVAAARKVADSLRRHGRIRRGYLGISTQSVPLPEVIRAQVGQVAGLMVISVEKGSPAERGGLLQGDVIITLAGQQVTSIEGLQSALGPDMVGQAVTVRLVRGGQVTEISITVGERE
ncbi:MAG: trypsin-like peptidase domain-containing protein [Anaerolineales bacterium]|nr:trypsin-like peptidase domain-containing protein [Anaerolineales bacterium]